MVPLYEFSSFMRHGKRQTLVAHTIDFAIINNRTFNDDMYVNNFFAKAKALYVEKIWLTPVMKLSR